MRKGSGVSRLALVLLVFCIGCINAASRDRETLSPTRLQESLSEPEFSKALIGKWKSVWELEGKETIEYLELTRNGEAKIGIQKGADMREIEGNYRIMFLRPASKGMVTLAELVVETPGETVVLSYVSFGLHNALPIERGPFLRIDAEPFGVLERAND